MGLSALLGEPEPAGVEPGGGPRPVPIEHLRPSPLQPRRHFGEEDLETLAESLRTHGMIQPLLVRPASDGGDGYEIVAGERRWRAAQRAGLHEVPVVVRELDDRTALALALVENLQRTDLGALEEAEAFRRLVEEFDHNNDSIAEAVGKSRSHVANTLRLLALPQQVQEMLADGRLSAGHARALIGARDPTALAGIVIARGLNVRQTEALAREEATARGTAERPRSADIAELERQLSARIGLEVGIRSRGRGKGGVLSIRWRDEDQFTFLLERFR
jgi:ParB family chromosome partitioning protein